MRGRIQREIDTIILANVRRFMSEYYERGKTRADLADEYNKATGKQVDPSFFSQVSGGHASLGKEVVEGLARALGKKVYQLYIPEELNHDRSYAMRGKYISVWGGKRNEPIAFSEKGLPLGVSMKQELLDSENPYVFAWEISEDSTENYDGITIRSGDVLVVEPGKEIFPGQLVWCRCAVGKVCICSYFPHDDSVELRPVSGEQKSKFCSKDKLEFQLYPVVKIIRPIRPRSN